MTFQHAAVWIDHHEARVFHVDAASFEESTIKAPQHRISRHHPASPEAKEHPADEQHFFHNVACALAGAQEILVVGPANAKLEFMKHVKKHDHALVPKILAVETADHPTDGQFAAYVRTFFLAADRMQGKR